MLQIGVSKETVHELHEAITDILGMSGDHEVLCKALDVLLTGCRVEHTIVENCNFMSADEED